MRIAFSKSAIDDLGSIKRYYEEQGALHIGQAFVESIMAQVETLSSHPDRGRVVPEFNDQSIREILHPPFRVVYLREQKSINVIRIWRSERLLKLP